MTLRSKLANGALVAATAALVLTTAIAAVPGVASAQPYDDAYGNPCQAQQNHNAVGGAIVGGIAGAVLGNSLGRGGGRAGATVLGGAAGAAVGAGVGSATTNCQADYPPPPPPGYDGGPPPPGYDNGPPPPGYDNGPPPQDYDNGPAQNCGLAQRQIIFPDGSQRRDTVQACQDPNGQWRLTPR